MRIAVLGDIHGNINALKKSYGKRRETRRGFYFINW